MKSAEKKRKKDINNLAEPKAPQFPQAKLSGAGGSAAQKSRSTFSHDSAALALDRGLSTEQVKARIKAGHSNSNFEEHTKSKFQIYKDNIFTLFNLVNLLIAMMVVYAALEDSSYWKNIMFTGVVISNTAMSIYQELKAKKTLDRLQILTMPDAEVLRDGRLQKIPADKIVRDDIVRLSRGKELSCDGIIVKAKDLNIDEAVLTGESLAQRKEKGDKVKAGTVVTAGEGYMQVQRLARESEAARITAEAKRIKRDNSGIKNDLSKIIAVITLFLFPIAFAMIVPKLAAGKIPVAEILVSTGAALIGMLPEGLYLMTSLAMLAGVRRLLKKKALCQSLSALEGLARIDTLCLDKTGTLTTGEMRVEEVLDLQETSGQLGLEPGVDLLQDAPHDPVALLQDEPRAPVDLLQDSPYGPVDLLQDEPYALVDRDRLQRPGEIKPALQNKRREALEEILYLLVEEEHDKNETGLAVAEYFAESGRAKAVTGIKDYRAFSSELKSTAILLDDGKIYSFGAPTFLIKDLKNEYPEIDSLIKSKAAAGYRVLMLCSEAAKGEKIKDNQGENKRRPELLIVIADIIRKEAAASLKYFQDEDVEIKIISGDDPLTAAGVAKRCGLNVEYLDFSQDYQAAEIIKGKSKKKVHKFKFNLSRSNRRRKSFKRRKRKLRKRKQRMQRRLKLRKRRLAAEKKIKERRLGYKFKKYPRLYAFMQKVKGGKTPKFLIPLRRLIQKLRDRDSEYYDEEQMLERFKALSESEDLPAKYLLVNDYNVFGRVKPEEKKLIVESLKAAGKKPAMIGDGVNDVPALKAADCSVAMLSGSDAAGNVADIVLLDNNFASLLDALAEGRRIINNIERVAELFLVKTIYSLLLSLFYVFSNGIYPLAPVQLTLVSNLTVGIPAFFLALPQNKRRIEGSFLKKVVFKALPSGIAASAVIILLEIMPLSRNERSTAALLLLLTVGFTTLVYGMQPVKLWKKLLFAACLSGAVAALVYLPSLVEAEALNLHFLLACLPFMALAIALIQLLRRTVEKYVLKIKPN